MNGKNTEKNRKFTLLTKHSSYPLGIIISLVIYYAGNLVLYTLRNGILLGKPVMLCYICSL